MRSSPSDGAGESLALAIRLTRRPDGAVVFLLRRADGTESWQKRSGPTAEFFAIHDLTHYAVETTLGFPRGFYGLAAEGWALTDFGQPWPRGPLPAEALPAELIVGCFDTARAAGEPLTAAQCNATLASWFTNAGRPVPAPVRDDQLDAIRAVLSDLVRRWHALTPGETLELHFQG